MTTLLDATGAQVLAPLWTNQSVFGPLTAPVVVAGDKLLCVAEQVIYAIDIHTGQQVKLPDNAAATWGIELDNHSGDAPHLTATNGVVYLMDGSDLRAVRLSDASPLEGWETPRRLGRAVSLIARHGLLMAIYQASKGASVRAFHAASGELAYREVKISDATPGPVGYGADAVFFVAGGKLHGVNIRSGDKRWTYAAHEKLSELHAPCIAGQLVLTSGQHLHGIDISEGTATFKIAPGAASPAVWHTPVYHIPTARQAATRTVNLPAQRPDSADDTPLPKAELDPALRIAAGVAVASNSQGDLICLSLADGQVLWRRQLATPGAPRIINNEVYVKTTGGTRLERFRLDNGASVGAPYALQGLPNNQPASIVNGMLLLPDEFGNISAQPYATQLAAYFNGSRSRIDIAADGQHFDIGERNFTVEAWFRSSSGGDILSGYPTKADANSAGFRLNLSPDGQIRVALFSGDAQRLRLGRTDLSNACDGNWHHVALVRRNDNFVIVLDGVPQEVRLPDEEGARRLSIGPHTALTIGAFVPQQGVAPTQHFTGLIREVRLWNCAMETTLIESNRQVALTGNEPQLLGLWRLDDVYASDKNAPVVLHNDAAGHRTGASFVDPGSRPTDLDMDRSAFPYLLREADKQWPYANTWGARGVAEVSGPAAVSTNGVVAFAAGPVLYAVGAHDGRRKWSMDISQRFSAPVAQGDSFLLLTQEDAVVRIDARSGAREVLPAFAALQPRAAAFLPAPAISATHMAAAAGTQLLIANRQAESATPVTLPGMALSLTFCQGGLLAQTVSGQGFHLALYDNETGREICRRQTGASAYCAGGAWVYTVENGALIKLDATDLGGAPLERQQDIADSLTGMAAAFGQGMLVVTDSNGGVSGLDAVSLKPKWRSTLPGSAGQRVNQPVFDFGGRIICTSESGAVAVLAARSGDLLGYYQMQTAAIHTPALHAGTVYTGCRDNPAGAQSVLDGAMHSLVLGDTVALRLNLDVHGQPLWDGKQHALIDKASEHTTLQLLRPGQSTIEAWINLPRLSGAPTERAGGGILGIAPSDESGFGINLWLDAAGVLHYEAHTLEDGHWSALHREAQAELMDGRWHHIAVSKRAGADNVALYVDGKVVETVSGASPDLPQRAASGLLAYIGATVAADRQPARHFHGMIAEVRVWDTYLVAPAILQRMQTKLRGDEPDLVAYWNFDYQAVHDSALQGHSGKLALASSNDAPAWWLTDLPFAQPNYPYIATSATVDTSDRGSTYALKAKVCAADGKGLPGQQVELWYIKQRPTDPDTVNINGTQLMAVRQGSEPDPVLKSAQAARVLRATTGADGTLTLNIATSQAGHGPALDLWTAFMPVNQRFHVNVLLDNQLLSKPAPPVLTAQAKLIQDYHYTSGDKINHERDRSTWRVVLRSREADGTIRMREPVTLWADMATTIEVAGVRHQINTERSITLDSQANGELVVVMEADQLVSPTLYARAGFMHRNERIIVNAAQDAQKQLESMRAADMTKERQTNWQKDPVANAKGESLLSKDQQPHASDISKAVRQVASAASDAAPKPLLKSAPSPARLKLAQLRRAQRTGGLLKAGAEGADDLRIDAMRQEEAGAQSDGVALMRSMAGVSREALANPDAFRASLGGALGFVISAADNGSGVIYKPLHDRAEVARLHAKAGPARLQVARPALLGGPFDFIRKGWNAIKKVATNIYEGAKSIAITIGESIQIAITKVVAGVTSVVNAVVATVQDALKAIAGFFEQLVIAIKKVIAFLRALFDWGAILKAQRFFIKLMNSAFSLQHQYLTDETRLRKLILSIGDLGGEGISGGKDSLSGQAGKAGGRDSAVVAGADGVQANSMLQKSQENPTTVRQTAALPDASGQSALTHITGIESILPGLANSILDLSPTDLVSQLVGALKAAIAGVLDSVATTFVAACGALAKLLKALQTVLQTRIYIPFVSEIYEWVTGTELSIMSLLGLALGVFFNALYAFVTLLIDGDARSFGDDAEGLSRRLDQLASGGAAPRAMLKTEALPRTNGISEVLYMGLRCITIAFDTISDGIHYNMAASGRFIPSPIETANLQGVGIAQATSSLCSSFMFTFMCEPVYHKRLAKGLGADRTVAERREWLIYSVYSLTGAVSLIKIIKNLVAALGDGKPSENCLLKRLGAAGDFVAKHLGTIMVGVGMAAAHLINHALTELYSDKTQTALNNMGYPDLKQQHVLTTYASVAALTPMLFEYFYTPYAMRTHRLPGFVYATFGAVRLLASGSSVALHGVATLKYGDVAWEMPSWPN